MTPDQTLLLTRDLVHAIATRPNESLETGLIRAETAIAQIEALAPGDLMETLFAGQIVLFQTLILDAVNDAHTADSPTEAHKHRQQAIALGRIQTSYLSELRRHRAKREAAQTQTETQDTQRAQTAEPGPTPEQKADRPEPAQAPHPFDPPRTTLGHTQRSAGTTGQRAHPTRHAAASMRWT